MKTCSITELGRMFGLSRSTLLYYDSIKLLSPAVRTASGYRVYSERDRAVLERICLYRSTGASLKEIKQIISGDVGFIPIAILKKRLRKIDDLVIELTKQRHLILKMLEDTNCFEQTIINPEKFVNVLKKIGLGEKQMRLWHSELEAQAPHFHRQLLELIGLPSEDIKRIKEWAANSDG